MASVGRNTTHKWPVSVYENVKAAKQQVNYLRKLDPSLLQQAEGRAYTVSTTSVHYYLARRQFYSLSKDEYDSSDVEGIDSNAEDALEETYETTQFKRTFLPEAFREGTYTVQNRPCRTDVYV